MARTLRFDSIFLCTPQLVSSWIYFPAWLSIVDTCPTHLVMDGSDFESYRARASGLNASPYSVVTWDTFDAYNSHDFLVTSRRYSELARADLSHVSETASRLASRVAADREWLHQMVLHGHESWLQYGLKLRHKLQWKNSVFAQAIDQTVLEIEDIKKGVFRFDPQILLRRYLKKLLVALVIRRKYAHSQRLPESRIRIFEIPEYRPAAELLARELNIDMSCFAIPTGDLERNEATVREILGLDSVGPPIWATDIDLLHEALEEINGWLQGGGSDHEVTEAIDASVADAENRVRRTRHGEHLLAAASLASSIATLVKAVADNSTLELVSAAGSFLGLYRTIAMRDEIIRDQLTTYSPAVRFIISRKLLFPHQARMRKVRLWKAHMLSMARNLVPRGFTQQQIEEECKRQMMGLWVTNPVWYDPN